jgi:two-component system, chemotaxis family, chemotaxis protein CheY
MAAAAYKQAVQRAAQFVNEYLVKPFTVAILREKIDAVFGAFT